MMDYEGYIRRIDAMLRLEGFPVRTLKAKRHMLDAANWAMLASPLDVRIAYLTMVRNALRETSDQLKRKINRKKAKRK